MFWLTKGSMFGWEIHGDQLTLEIIPGTAVVHNIKYFRIFNNNFIHVNSNSILDSIQTQMKNSGILILELQLWEI